MAHMTDNTRDTISQVIVRLPEDIAVRLEVLTDMYRERSLLKGIKVGRATVAREAIMLGLPILERKFAKNVEPKAPQPKKAPSK